MLRYLRVSNLAVVREVSIELDAGLTVLTGETGAGKSILVDALALLLGARGSADLLRTGASGASVEGIFRVESGSPAGVLLGELGTEAEEGELVIRRELVTGGRSRAFVGGSLQPVGALRRVGALLADIYGQLEHVRLLDPATHLDLLDHFAGLGEARAGLASDWRRLRELDAAVGALAASQAERARRGAFLRFELGEIEQAAPRPGEDDELARERSVLRNRARVLELAEGAYQELYESEGSILERLAGVQRALGELSGFDARTAGAVPQLETARLGIEDLALMLRDYARDVPHETGRLEQVEARLAVLERLMGKYGRSVAEMLSFADKARAELSSLVVSDDERAAMEEERGRLRDGWLERAAEVAERRRRAARRLEERVEHELAELAMERTRFRVRFGPSEASATGTDRVELLVSTNVGEEPRPLARVASGGELSRLLLALRTVAADHEPGRIAVFHGLEAGLGGRVTVFDEVDAGIGGRVAYVLADKLRRLAAGRQVLCITHLAPVAAVAERHLRVRKEERRGRTEVVVEPLAGEARVAEISRMIGGDRVTDAVRRHAEELLAGSGAPRD